MEFTHLVLVLVDDTNNNIVIKSGEFTYYDGNKYRAYNQDWSFVVACPNAALAKKIRSALDAVVFDDLAVGISYAAYKIDSLYKLQDLAEIYDEYLKGVSVKKIADLVPYENSKMDYIYHSLNFYKVFNEIIRQIDDAIAGGAYFERVKKTDIFSIVHDRTASILDTITVPWAYNKDGNIIIDYSGIVAWKALGVYIPNRQLVELKYFF